MLKIRHFMYNKFLDKIYNHAYTLTDDNKSWWPLAPPFFLKDTEKTFSLVYCFNLTQFKVTPTLFVKLFITTTQYSKPVVMISRNQ